MRRLLLVAAVGGLAGATLWVVGDWIGRAMAELVPLGGPRA